MWAHFYCNVEGINHFLPLYVLHTNSLYLDPEYIRIRIICVNSCDVTLSQSLAYNIT